MANHPRLSLQGDQPVAGRRSRSGELDLRMRLQEFFQHRLLIGREIHEEDVLAVLQGFFEADEIVVGFLDSQEPSLPRAKAEHDDGEEYEGDPAGRRFRPAGKISNGKNQRGRADSNHGAPDRRVDDIGPHERLDLVQMPMLMDLCLVAAQYMDLRRADAGSFQLLFQDLQVVQAVADEIMPEQLHNLVLLVLLPRQLYLSWICARQCARAF